MSLGFFFFIFLLYEIKLNYSHIPQGPLIIACVFPLYYSVKCSLYSSLHNISQHPYFYPKCSKQ